MGYDIFSENIINIKIRFISSICWMKIVRALAIYLYISCYTKVMYKILSIMQRIPFVIWEASGEYL